MKMDELLNIEMKQMPDNSIVIQCKSKADATWLFELLSNKFRIWENFEQAGTEKAKP